MRTCGAPSVTIIEEEKLVENAARLGEFMLSRLKDMQERHPFIGHVDGKGLLIGVELVTVERQVRADPEDLLDLIVCSTGAVRISPPEVGQVGECEDEPDLLLCLPHRLARHNRYVEI